jgi:Peptidase inhibitor family I36
MHTVPVAQKVFLSALVALALLAGALFVAAPKASASKSQCSANTVCAWENSNFTGNFSQWAASDTGCHNHAGNPKIRSGWNRTGVNVRFGGAGVLEPGKAFELLSGDPITGEICWPV